jgi:O-antigen ligase
MSIVLGVIVSLSGITYQILRLKNLGYLNLKFYSILGANALNFDQKIIFGKIPKMYTFVGEPGWTALFLLYALGLAFTPLFLGKNDSNVKGRNTFFLIIITMALLLTTSTTAYLGLLIYLASLGFVLLLKLKPARYTDYILKNIALGSIFVIALYIIFNSIFRFSLYDFFLKTQVAKLMLEYGSGPTRFHYITESLRIFSQYPILGVGIGSNRSTAMLPSLLSNIGLIGTLPFLLFHLYIFRNVFNLYLKSNDENMLLSASLFTTFLTLFMLMSIARSISSLYFIHYWVLLAMMSRISRKGNLS